MNDFDRDGAMRERNYNVKLPDRFRYAFVLKPGDQYDFSALRPYCGRFLYATDGYAESAGDINAQLHEGLAGFDATKDILIPVGSNSICLQAGVIIARRCMIEGHDWDAYNIAVFSAGVYEYWRIPLSPEEEAFQFELGTKD